MLFASMNRSTQFCIQDCSFRSSAPAEILLVTHFRKHLVVPSALFQSLKKLIILRVGQAVDNTLYLRLLILVLNELVELLLLLDRHVLQLLHRLGADVGGIHGGRYWRLALGRI